MSEYDAAAVIEERERLAPPRWKRFDCPTCGAEAGYPCSRILRAHLAVNPHAARKRAAALPSPPKVEAGK